MPCRLPSLLGPVRRIRSRPPAQVDVLVRALSAHLPLDVRVTERAGHFSFMDLPPPDEVEPLADRQAFLDLLAEEIGKFLKR